MEDVRRKNGGKGGKGEVKHRKNKMRTQNKMAEKAERKGERCNEDTKQNGRKGWKKR